MCHLFLNLSQHSTVVSENRMTVGLTLCYSGHWTKWPYAFVEHKPDQWCSNERCEYLYRRWEVPVKFPVCLDHCSTHLSTCNPCIYCSLRVRNVGSFVKHESAYILLIILSSVTPVFLKLGIRYSFLRHRMNRLVILCFSTNCLSPNVIHRHNMESVHLKLIRRR